MGSSLDGKCLRSGPFVLRLETLVITEHTHSENNDWQESVGEQSFASETPTQPSTAGTPSNDKEQLQKSEAPGQEALPTAATEDAVHDSPGEHAGQSKEQAAPAGSADQEAAHASAQQPSTAAATNVSQTAEDVPLYEQPTDTSPAEPERTVDDATASLFSTEENEASGRAFTDFIEEFRQKEERFSTFLNEPESSFSSFRSDADSVREPMVFLESSADVFPVVIDDVSPPLNTDASQEKEAEAQNETSTTSEGERPRLNQPGLSAERPVSPLLRPATRVRLPRHGRHRNEEVAPPTEQPKTQLELAGEEKPALAETTAEEQPARPARRYRFDRPAATASASLSATKASAPARASEPKEKHSTPFVAQKANSVSTEPAPARTGNSASAPSEASAQKSAEQETLPATTETNTPLVAPPVERRRRGNHDRQREKEQTTAVVAAPVAPAPEPVVAEPAPVAESEAPLEDLPPLEYSELQAANSRRRRRRRVGGSSSIAAVNAPIAPKVTSPELPAATPPVPAPAPSSPLALPKSPAPAAQSNYNIVSGYTVSQMNQGNDASGPFMGPEPSPARGSAFGSTTPALRHVRNEALRAAPTHPIKHGEAPLISPTAINHLANAVSQAIQTQTDRMVTELRRANQVPTNVSVSLPPFPSTERVGVFVDVANLLYSARTLRMTVDFGKLLDFLRGNRRLVRAQAYCPTSPQPGDDQMFLQAVKGLGYRITTKNYKTFSSGAKKADLDLDLCMDVVRLVDGNAVDCIVLVSGDSDFMPMLDYCSDHGVRVEVAAFDESMSATLRQSCDLFVNLSLLEEIRA